MTKNLDNNRVKTLVNEYVSNGFNQTKAGKVIGVDDTHAYRLFKQKKVQEYLAKRLAEIDSKYEAKIDKEIGDKTWKRERLIKIAENSKTKNVTVIRCIAELNKMDGDHAPTKTVNANFNLEINEALFNKYKRDY